MSMKKIAGKLIYILFCAFTGVVIALILWTLLRVMKIGIDFVWGWVPENINIPFYTLGVCLLGGLLIGLYCNLIGPYPEELNEVMAKVKRDKFYPYNNVLAVCLAALLPLVFGASIGPEAGLTGVIVGLCYWAGNHMKYLKEKIPNLMQVGLSATLSVVFAAPLFGLVAPIEEEIDGVCDVVIPRGSKIISNIIAIMAAAGTFFALSSIFGGGISLPRIEKAAITNTERLWGVPLALVGVVFGYLYLLFDKSSTAFFTKLKGKCNVIVSTVLGGLILGIIGTYFPLTMFSGEHQITELEQTYTTYAPWLLILIGVLKLFLTNVCIKSGWRGGHFFPVIFCGISIGYGVAMLTGLDAPFCLAVVTAGLMGVIMRKPVAVSALLMLCFNVRIIPWLVIAAFIGSVVPLGPFKKKAKAEEQSEVKAEAKSEKA